MIKSLLIANRGEIAIRLLKTANRMDIKTFCFQTPQEANAVYLRWADEVIVLPDENVSRSIFLDAAAIVAYAKQYKIEGIHPGYGFLSENPLLPKLCNEAGIVFVGPDAQLIEQMGDKNQARHIAIDTGLTVVKGSDQPILSIEAARQVIKETGYPVILKALAGGGGKGMRIVHQPEELESAYKMAVNEAKNAFGNGAMLIERYVEEPRHIEVQVLADKHGNAVHLFERECSIQRNHQKLLEEAPSAALTDELRKKMTADALALVKKTGYFTLGTVEFLLDKAGQHYFMEMNTRIQVEHPVTEAITGLDLVEWQIRTACGEPLTFKQSDVKKKGWAIEFRVNAEDVQAAFSPDFGIIDEMNFPAYPGLRVDSGFVPGSVIPSMYDSLMAKLIVSGRNREAALERALEIMERSRIKGVKTTIPFFKAVLHDPRFISGNFNTAFIAGMKTPFHQEANEEEAAALMALQYYLDEMQNIRYGEMKTENATPWISRMWNKLF
ncbi:acetyl-CoA carboxylase biotin carboxylase subunit [Geofilum sp. OHC36d9]|uniref:acetyl-CoA carboxylase biotin carboxylase subunit n=1 Tax=Geofilum sp. OHC36d9 TaxID=3458413 RepID=UPI004034A12D